MKKVYMSCILLILLLFSCSKILNDKDLIMSYKSFSEKKYQDAISRLNQLPSDYRHKLETDKIKTLLENKKYSEAKIKFKSIMTNDKVLYEVYKKQGLAGWYYAEHYMIVGINLYYGENDDKILIGKIVNFDKKYDSYSGRYIDCVNVKMKKSGTIECKDKDAVGTWYVNEEDPMFSR